MPTRIRVRNRHIAGATSPIGGIDPPVDYVVRYKLDGTDAALTAVGSPIIINGPVAPEGKASWLNDDGGFGTYYNADSESSKFYGAETGFTVTAWVKVVTTITGQGKAIIHHGQTGASLDGFNVRLSNDNKIQVVSNNNFGGKGNTDLNDGKWHHVAGMYTGTERRVYVDGVLDATPTSFTFNTITGATETRIGVNQSANNAWFGGGIDDVRYYSRALSAAEIRAIANERQVHWTPAFIPTLGWFDAMEISTITESAGAVSQLDDKSGNSHNLTQGTGSAQPIVYSRYINRMPVLDFDGANDFLSIADKTFFDAPCEVFFCGSTDDTSSLQQITGRRETGENFYLFRYVPTGLVETFITGPGSVNLSIDTAAHVIHSFYGADSSDLYGIDIDGGTPSTGTMIDNFNTPAYTGNIKVGQRSDSAEHDLNGLFGEMVVVNSVLSASNRDRITGYLAWKWGLVASLDAGHPYKSAPPLR